MERKKRKRHLLLAGTISFFLFLFYLNFVSPDQRITFFTIQLPPLIPFFFLLFLFLYCFTTYLTHRGLNGLLVSVFITAYLLLRLNNLTHPIFFLLLLALFIVLELLLTSKKPTA